MEIEISIFGLGAMRHYHTKPLELTIRNVDGGTIWWNRVAMVNANWKFTTARWDHVGTVEKENSKLREKQYREQCCEQCCEQCHELCCE